MFTAKFDVDDSDKQSDEQDANERNIFPRFESPCSNQIYKEAVKNLCTEWYHTTNIIRSSVLTVPNITACWFADDIKSTKNRCYVSVSFQRCPFLNKKIEREVLIFLLQAAKSRKKNPKLVPVVCRVDTIHVPTTKLHKCIPVIKNKNGIKQLWKQWQNVFSTWTRTNDAKKKYSCKKSQ